MTKNPLTSACFWRFSQPNWPHKKPARQQRSSRGSRAPCPPRQPSCGRAVSGLRVPGPGSPEPGPRTRHRTKAQPTVFTVSNESPLAPKLTTLSLLTMKWEKLGPGCLKNWCNGDIFWCWPSHMENELKATNKSYFGPRMLSC